MTSQQSLAVACLATCAPAAAGGAGRGEPQGDEEKGGAGRREETGGSGGADREGAHGRERQKVRRGGRRVRQPHQAGYPKAATETPTTSSQQPEEKATVAVRQSPGSHRYPASTRPQPPSPYLYHIKQRVGRRVGGRDAHGVGPGGPVVPVRVPKGARMEGTDEQSRRQRGETTPRRPQVHQTRGLGETRRKAGRPRRHPPAHQDGEESTKEVRDNATA